MLFLWMLPKHYNGTLLVTLAGFYDYFDSNLPTHESTCELTTKGALLMPDKISTVLPI
jgi:hypothetical protein